MQDIKKSRKRSRSKKVILWTIGILAIPVLAWFLASGAARILGIFGGSLRSNSLFLKNFLPNINNADFKLKGEDQDRINILLLGMPGAGNPGPELTDTIILLSIKPKENKAAMLSIPRDLYVKAPNTQSYTRINSIYTYGEQRTAWLSNKVKGSKSNSSANSQSQDGYDYIGQAVAEVTGQPIHYYLKMDFNGFEQIIDQLGGIDIYVDKDINDPYFPDGQYGYKTFKISKGQHHMDGNLALKYARSRKTTSDFDRAKRQQQILTAIKEKTMGLSIFDAGKVVNIIKIIGDHFKTDLSLEEINRLVKISKEVKQDEIIVSVLDNSAKGPLKSANYNGASVMIPKLGMGKYAAIQQIAQNIFEGDYLASEAAKIEIQNGSSTAGLANQTAQSLKEYGLNIIKVTNSQTKYQNTKIIDYTSGQKPKTIQLLESKLNGVVTKETPTPSVKADIVVIIGANFKGSEI